MQKDVLKEKFYISSTSLQELEHIKVSRNKEEQVKYAARKILHILDENESSYNVIVTDSKIIDIINQHGLENTPDNQICACASTIEDVVFITNDIACKSIARHIFGLKTETVKEEEKPTLNVEVAPKKSSKKPVKITFLGGVGEIGKNMTAIEYDNEIIVIDGGLSFPTGEFPGIDLVVPDISYLLANKSKVKGILLTHGHEDHIGGLPYILNELKVPVYGTAMTLALLDNKMQEHKIEYKGVCVKPKNLLKIGNFQVEFIKVSHSIAGSLALSISTPCGNIIHTGDFKIDFAPIDGVMTDLNRFGELGKKGVNLLLCESTNVCRKGYSMSESNVGKTLETLFDKFKGKRLFVATFASNVHRLQQLLWLAEGCFCWAKYDQCYRGSSKNWRNFV